MDLALNSLQRLICYKTQTNNLSVMFHSHVLTPPPLHPSISASDDTDAAIEYSTDGTYTSSSSPSVLKPNAIKNSLGSVQTILT